ncbi:hypothetical protein V8G54_024335 [Vigna mungo]|uniref:Retrotransposon Copia-like N-terminal domain-containing protein n=1 Tax=Vigna mungo TaxID=3915 RepID=A0AAQ3RT39_VIGMU
MGDSSANDDSSVRPLNAFAAESIWENLTPKMTEALSKVQPTSQSSISDSSTVPINIKLDGSNYALWSQVAEMYISCKDKLGYIDGSFPPPSETDSAFGKWRTENAIVKGWLINSMDSALVGNFIRFPTTKEVWDAIGMTYFDGSDTLQVYDLRRKEEKVYIFLDELDDRLDKIRSDILQLKPFPTIEQAYAYVRREDTRQTMMTSGAEYITSGAVTATKGSKVGQ